ncbi:MAG: COG3650 family protein [Allosphingosinicella sp.]
MIAFAAAGCASEAPESASESGHSEAKPSGNEGALPAHNLAVAEAEVPAQPPRASSRQPWSATGYRLIGTEPFWGGTASAGKVLYSTPENQAGDEIAATARFEPDQETYVGRLNGAPFILTLSAGPCSDGMSDNVRAFTASLQVNRETRQGCADPRP